jgi:hypothetical protein
VDAITTKIAGESDQPDSKCRRQSRVILSAGWYKCGSSSILMFLPALKCSEPKLLPLPRSNISTTWALVSHVDDMETNPVFAAVTCVTKYSPTEFVSVVAPVVDWPRGFYCIGHYRLSAKALSTPRGRRTSATGMPLHQPRHPPCAGPASKTLPRR